MLARPLLALVLLVASGAAGTAPASGEVHPGYASEAGGAEAVEGTPPSSDATHFALERVVGRQR